MAWFSYNCPDCGLFKKSLEKREKNVLCPKCSAPSHAIIKTGTIQVIERLDNGAMARSVERMVDIERIMEERSDKSSQVDKDEQ